MKLIKEQKYNRQLQKEKMEQEKNRLNKEKEEVEY